MKPQIMRKYETKLRENMKPNQGTYSHTSFHL